MDPTESRVGEHNLLVDVACVVDAGVDAVGAEVDVALLEVDREPKDEGQLAEEDQLHLSTNEMVGVGVAVVELLVQPQQETEVQGIVDGIVDSMGRAEATMMLPRLVGWTHDSWTEEISADFAVEDPSV
jgi:hypothetical protein